MAASGTRRQRAKMAEELELLRKHLVVDDLKDLLYPPYTEVIPNVLKLIKASQVEYNLPKADIDWVSEKFQVMEPGGFPRIVQDVRIFGINGEADLEMSCKAKLLDDVYVLVRYDDEDEAFHKKVIKELCVFHRLQDLEGSRVPRMLFFGTFNAPGSPPFFSITELFEPVLAPKEISPSEMHELLDDVHARQITLGSKEYFPRVARVDSKLVLADFATADFEQSKRKLKEDREFLISLCGAGD